MCIQFKPVSAIKSSIKLKLIISFLIIIFLMGGIAVLSFTLLRTYLLKEDGMIEKTIVANQIVNSTKEITVITSGYILTNMPDFSDRKEKVFNELDKIKNNINYLKGVIIDKEAQEKLSDIIALTTEYEAVLKRVFESSEEDKLSETALKKDRSRKIAAWIQGSVAELISAELIYQQDVKHELNKNANIIGIMVYGIIILLGISGTIYALAYSNRVGGDISNLAHTARKIADGDLYIDEFATKSRDEILILAESFNYMVSQIKKSIESIEEKAKIENKLKEQEIKTLEYSSLLNEAELRFLQSQINPHFLFNTMNTIGSMARAQKADNIKKMIESVADILRYNLKKLDQTVTLAEEYSIVRNYVFIQETRFGGKIEFSFDVDENALVYKVPSMILQPFIENAIIHGLEPMEDKGVLELKILETNEGIEIYIKDNGAGMDENTLDDILNNREKYSGASRMGIGVNNVIRRLELTYGRNVVDIKSQLGAGTEVIIKLDKFIRKNDSRVEVH